MELREQVAHLERALARQGVAVRRERFDDAPRVVSGGICRLGTTRLVLLDADAPPAEARGVLLDALRRVGADAVWLPPILRNALDEKA